MPAEKASKHNTPTYVCNLHLYNDCLDRKQARLEISLKKSGFTHIQERTCIYYGAAEPAFYCFAFVFTPLSGLAASVSSKKFAKTC